MTRWWPTAFPSQPYNTWFAARVPNESQYDEWPNGIYHFYKIPADSGHREQLMFYSDEDRYYKTAEEVIDTVFGVGVEFYAGVRYIFCYDGDTPNQSFTYIEISPPCSNWVSDFYMATETTRSQSWGLNAAIQANREKAAGISAAVAKDFGLDAGISATIQGNPTLDAGISATIQGNPEKSLRLRAAVRGEGLLEPGIVAAIAQDFGLDAGISATIQGNPWQHYHIKAAIKGETEKSVGIVAYIVKSRIDHILIEMENLGPQELDLRSTPNWRSQVKDWRKSTLGE